MARSLKPALWIISTCALGLGCAGGAELARDFGTALGEGAAQGLGGYVSYGSSDQWGESWTPSGRGATGVAPRSAAKPDCSLSEDESQLYVGPALANPSSFVSTLDGSLDHAGFQELARTGFRLKGERAGGVIAVLHTTAGRHARFVLRWDERPHLHDVTVYDAGTGEASLRFEIAMPLAPHALVNLDPGEPEGFDLLFGPGADGRLTLAAGDGAGLSFPLESMCR